MTICFKNFKEIKKNAKNYYQSIGKVWCPYFKDFVYFNSIGFEHLLFKSKNNTRKLDQQYLRLKFLKLVPKIILRSGTLQEFREKRIFVKQKINFKWEKRKKIVKFYGFIAIVDGVRLKIVIRDIEGGFKGFYSIFPYWRINKNGNKIFYSADLGED